MSNYSNSSDFARKLTTTTLDCGKTLRQLTDYRNVTLWWFAHFDFIDFLLRLPADFADYNPKGLRFQSWISRLPPVIFAALNFCFDLTRKVIIRTALILYSKKKLHHHNKNTTKKILFTSPDLMWQNIRDYDTHQVRKTDALYDSLINTLRRQDGFCLISTYPLVKYVHPFRSAFQSLRVLTDKLRNWDIPHRPFNLYWTTKVAAKEYQAAKHFRKVWKTLANDEKFRRLCVFGDTDISGLLAHKLRFFFLILFPYAVKRIEMAARMLEQQNPDLVLLTNEYGIFERSLLIAAKSKGIPTTAIQHGNITAFHQGYMYRPEEISQTGEFKTPFCPIPDKTAVFGPYFKELLTRTSAYPENSIAVTGQPRYDSLDTLKKRYSPQSILKEHGIDTEKKIVLWTTQSIGLSDDENIRNLQAFNKMMAEKRDYIVIIKQHPREGRRYTRMFENYLGLHRPDIVVVPGNADTLSLIRACDIMITKWSTTAIEALALEKPLIIMNLSDEPDKVDYVKQQVALGVYQPEDLPTTIEKLLNNSPDIAEHRKKYIEQYLYKIDGKATLRIIELINEVLEKAKAEKKRKNCLW